MRYLIIVLSLTLASCQTGQPVPQVTYSFNGAPYRLNVTSIEFVEDYRPSKQPPHVETQASHPPIALFKEWMSRKLIAVGTRNTLEASVKNASIVRRDLPKSKKGIEGIFYKEQTEAFDGVMEVDLKIYDGESAFPVAVVHAEAKQTRTLIESATLLGRQYTYDQISADLMRALEVELDREMHRYFSAYLR